MAEKKKRPSQVADRFIVRMPDGLRDEIKKNAVENRRTMNAEILMLIERGMEVLHGKAA